MRWLVTLAALSLVACADDPGTCPEPKPLDYFQSGSYTASGGKAVDYYCRSGCSAVFVPHDGVSQLDLALDLEQSVAVISYQRDGKLVEERWKITARASR